MKQDPKATIDNLDQDGQVTGRTIAQALQRLRRSCRVTLEAYMDAASLNSGQLLRLSPQSLDDLGRANLAVLKRKEDGAHQVYLSARDTLLNLETAVRLRHRPGGQSCR
jgi:hypothetical protein